MKDDSAIEIEKLAKKQGITNEECFSRHKREYDGYCPEWKGCRKQDIRVIPTINMKRIMDLGDREFNIRILNNDKIVHNMSKLVLYAGKWIFHQNWITFIPNGWKESYRNQWVFRGRKK